MNYIRILSYNAWDVVNYVANDVMSNHIAKHTNFDIYITKYIYIYNDKRYLQSTFYANKKNQNIISDLDS